MRDFEKWLGGFRSTMAGYDYYVDFGKVFSHIDDIKIELNILNSLIGSKNIDADFDSLLTKYPEVLRCLPILLAKREMEIAAMDENGIFEYRFDKPNYSLAQYKYFMRHTGLFDLLQNHIVKDLVDYVTGVEVGMDTHARKNRSGDLMEDLVEKYLQDAGFVKDTDYFKEMNASKIESKWGLDMSSISNDGKAEKRFDFVVKGKENVYGIEANFFQSQSGSKLNEVARSYKTIALEAAPIEGFKFVWITDGQAWQGAKNNLLETFEVLENLYNVQDLESGLFTKIFK